MIFAYLCHSDVKINLLCKKWAAWCGGLKTLAKNIVVFLWPYIIYYLMLIQIDIHWPPLLAHI